MLKEISQCQDGVIQPQSMTTRCSSLAEETQKIRMISTTSVQIHKDGLSSTVDATLSLVDVTQVPLLAASCSSLEVLMVNFSMIGTA